MSRAWDHEHSQVFESSLVEIYRGLFDEGGTAIDIGCWRGLHSRLLAKYAERVYAFDPLDALTKENKAETICYIQKALSNFKARKPFYIHSNLPRSSGMSVSEVSVLVDYDKLDNFHLENIKFIKMDAEGTEYDIIEGAINTIRQSRPVIYIEGNSKYYDEFLQNFNKNNKYQLVMLNSGWSTDTSPYQKLIRDCLLIPNEKDTTLMQDRFKRYINENKKYYMRWL